LNVEHSTDVVVDISILNCGRGIHILMVCQGNVRECSEGRGIISRYLLAATRGPILISWYVLISKS
jgi:hypothetical protein